MDRLLRPGRRAEQVLALLATLDTVRDAGGKVSELDHSLRMATLAERSGAGEDVVLAALLHDVGKVFGDAGHGAIAAALLEPHLGGDVVEVVRHHQAFTARHWGLEEGQADPRDRFRDEPWYPLAERFVDEWEMQSFQEGDATFPLAHFEELVRRRIVEP